MSARTHVWLLYQLAPLQSGILSWPWWTALLARLGGRARLTGPGENAAARATASAQARWLDHRLNDSAGCRAVFFDGPGAEGGASEAAGSVGARDVVLLLPMAPELGEGAEALIAEARRALGDRGVARALRAAGEDPEEAIEAQAERVRAAISDLPPGVAYEVLFAATGISASDPAFDVLTRLTAEISAAIGLRLPHRLVPLGGLWRGGRMGSALRAIGRRGVPAVILVPINAALNLSSAESALARALASGGISAVLRAPPADLRPTFLRGILARIRAAAPDAVGPRS